MPFTRFPPRLKVPVKTRHTELLAVLGKVERDSRLHVAVGDELLSARYAGRCRYLHERWTWGTGTPKRVACPGVIVAAREDGTVVAFRDEDLGEYDGNFQLDVWQAGKKRRTIAVPKFGSMDAAQSSASFVHGVLVYERQKIDDEAIAAVREGKGRSLTLLRLVDVDKGKSIDLINGKRGPSLTLRAAPDRQLAVLSGNELSFFELERGRKRRALTLEVPDKHAIYDLALSPDGATAVIALFRCPTLTVSRQWRGYHVVSLRTGKITHALPKEAESESLSFVAGGRVLAASSTSGTLALFDTRTWKLLERFKVEASYDSGPRLIPWEARGALVVVGRVGLTYVFKVNAEPETTGLEGALQEEPGVSRADRGARKKLRAPTHPPRRTRGWPQQAFEFELAARGDDQFGGLPNLPKDRWPSCQHCEEPMMFVLALDASKSRLPLEKHDSLMLFVCSSGCDTFEPFGGSNAAVLVTGGQKARPVPRGFLGRPSVMKPRKLRYTPAKKAPEGEIRNKVGGAPDWLQGDETPSCPDCKRKMRFVMQLDESVDAKLNFASGVGYLFVCEDEHDARFLWQS